MFKYYGTNQGTTWDKSNLHISRTCNHRISFSRQGLFQFFQYLVNTFYLPNSNQSTNILYRVKGHRETNSSFIFIKLLTIWAKILFFTTRIIPILSFYWIQNQICSNMMVQNKGQRATSLTFSFLKLVTIESHFRDKDYSNTFILPDTKTKYVQILWYKSWDNERQV